MIGEAARVGKMLANAAARVIHEQPVQDIGSLADRCRDHLGCERRILIGHMAVSIEARDVAIFRVDQIHRLAPLGSASWWGRGCQSLTISVAAGTIKKTT